VVHELNGIARIIETLQPDVMLSPMPVASMWGLGSNPSLTITPFSLGHGGNAITLLAKLYARMRQEAALPEKGGALEMPWPSHGPWKRRRSD
jgi:hypothetical protein